MATEIAGAELQFLKLVDRAATIEEARVKAFLTAVAGGVSFWDLADAADDQVFENCFKGWDLSELDTLLAAGGQGHSAGYANLFSDAMYWITTSASAARPGLGYASWRAFFGLLTNDDADLGKFWRVPWQFAELYYDKYRTRLLPINVGAKGVLSETIGDNATAGLHHFGTLTRPGGTEWVAGDGDLDTDLTVGAPMLINSDSDDTSTAITASVTVKKISSAGAAGTKAYTGLVCPKGVDIHALLGEIAITTGPAAGQKVILSTSIPALAVAPGDYVLIWESDVLHEIAEVAIMTTSTSLTLAKNLKHTYTTAAVIWPLYTGISGTPTTTGGTAGKIVKLYARPDRIITLGS
jgi:hypothetical protein